MPPFVTHPPFNLSPTKTNPLTPGRSVSGRTPLTDRLLSPTGIGGHQVVNQNPQVTQEDLEQSLQQEQAFEKAQREKLAAQRQAMAEQQAAEQAWLKQQQASEQTPEIQPLISLDTPTEEHQEEQLPGMEEMQIQEQPAIPTPLESIEEVGSTVSEPRDVQATAIAELRAEGVIEPAVDESTFTGAIIHDDVPLEVVPSEELQDEFGGLLTETEVVNTNVDDSIAPLEPEEPTSDEEHQDIPESEEQKPETQQGDFANLLDQDTTTEEEQKQQETASQLEAGHRFPTLEDGSPVIVIPTVSSEELLEDYQETITRHNTEGQRIWQASNGKYTRQQIDRYIETKYLSDYATYNLLESIYVDSTRLTRQALRQALERGDKLSRSWIDENGVSHSDKIADKSIIDSIKTSEAVLKGASAIRFVAAATSGIRRVFLAHSGFHIDLKGPTNAMLDMLYNNIIDGEVDYGKIFGMYMFSPADLLIKQAIMEQVPRLVVDCNLMNWDSGDRLLQFIALPDYEAIIHALASLMFPEGADIDFQCFNKQCAHQRHTLKVDITQMKFTNHTAMPTKNKSFMYDRSPKNDEQLKNYRSTLGFNQEIKLFDNWTCKTRIPTLSEYFAFSSAFNAKLANAIQG